MVKRLASHQVLQHLQDIESDCFDGGLSDSENPLRNDAYSSVVESDKKRIAIDSSEEDTDHDAVTDLDENNDGVQNFIEKNGSS